MLNPLPLSSPTATNRSCYPVRVAVIGAGRVGSTVAQRLVEKGVADVVLLDVVNGLPQGIALDLMEAGGIERHNRQVLGTSDYGDTAGSSVVVITAGQARRPGMAREELLQTNARIVVEAAQRAIAHSPDAVLVVVTNPLDVMTYLGWKASGLPPTRVVGMAGVLDAARFQAFIGMTLGVSMADISAMVLGGHGDQMVPLPRYSTVNGIPITELLSAETIEQLVQRTRHGGAEIVELMQVGSAYFAPASAVALMVEAILHNESRLLPVSAYLQGEYGLRDLFLGVPCRLGCRGVESVLELQLLDGERETLHSSAQFVQNTVKQALFMLE